MVDIEACNETQNVQYIETNYLRKIYGKNRLVKHLEQSIFESSAIEINSFR